jgi:hypothetical protein
MKRKSGQKPSGKPWKDPVSEKRYREHRAEILARNREWYAKNSKEIQAKRSIWKREHPEIVRRYRKAYRDNPEGREHMAAYGIAYFTDPAKRMRLLANGAILRAKQKGLPFDESIRLILEANPPMICTCCGISLDYSMGKGRMDKHPHSPSLDRFDPKDGYTIANTFTVCWRCNNLKRDGSVEEFEKILAYMKRPRELKNAA